MHHFGRPKADFLSDGPSIPVQFLNYNTAKLLLRIKKLYITVNQVPYHVIKAKLFEFRLDAFVKYKIFQERKTFEMKSLVYKIWLSITLTQAVKKWQLCLRSLKSFYFYQITDFEF